jgi:hypothetical protein
MSPRIALPQPSNHPLTSQGLTVELTESTSQGSDNASRSDCNIQVNASESWSLPHHFEVNTIPIRVLTSHNVKQSCTPSDQPCTCLQQTILHQPLSSLCPSWVDCPRIYRTYGLEVSQIIPGQLWSPRNTASTLTRSCWSCAKGICNPEDWPWNQFQRQTQFCEIRWSSLAASQGHRNAHHYLPSRFRVSHQQHDDGLRGSQ